MTAMPVSASPLSAIEPRLRPLLPADLYATAWVDPSPAQLVRVFEHLRTLQRILVDYTPRVLAEQPPQPGQVRYDWQTGSLMFTDLAGFTRLLEGNARLGPSGADVLLGVLNRYFAAIIETISKSGGDLLEFTGDALLVLFPEEQRRPRHDITQAVRAGLRMQRVMADFAHIQTPAGEFTLGMRVGIHRGRFLWADIGTPRRMEHVLLGSAVQQAKLSESNGQTGRVCLSAATYEEVKEQFRFEPGKETYRLVVDDLQDEQLGEYDVTTSRRRVASSVMFDRSPSGLVTEITERLAPIESLAGFLPGPVLELLIESAADRQIPADFTEPTVMFVNFIGLPELVDKVLPGEEIRVVNSFSRAFALINAAVEARGGVLKKITYHLSGSDIVIYFGVPNAHTDDPIRAVQAACAIREIVAGLKPPTVLGVTPRITCQIGIARGPAFSAEIGEPRGRREFNVLGDTVNTAARLMNRAVDNQIFITGRVHDAVAGHFACESLGEVALKGKAAPVAIYAVKEPLPR